MITSFSSNTDQGNIFYIIILYICSMWKRSFVNWQNAMVIILWWQGGNSTTNPTLVLFTIIRHRHRLSFLFGWKKNTVTLMPSTSHGELLSGRKLIIISRRFPYLRLTGHH